jgi:hypothetical protein
MPKLIATVHVRDADGVVSVFGPGDTVPAWASKLIVNPKAWDTADFAKTVDEPGLAAELSGSAAGATNVPVPAKGGKGSGLPKWQAYAKFKGYEFDDDASREDIISALEADGVPTE